MKFFVVVALLFLMQTLVGGAVAHYRADPGSFYGFQLETHLSQQSAAHLASADGDLLDRHRLCGRRAVPGPLAARR